MKVELRTRAVSITGSHFKATAYRNEFWVYHIHTDQGEVSIFADGRLPNLEAAMRDPIEVISMECDENFNTTSITREPATAQTATAQFSSTMDTGKVQISTTRETENV